MMKRFFWTAFCNKKRLVGISDIEQIISKYGYIADFKMFSDISIVLTVELRAGNIDPLANALRDYLLLEDFKPIDFASEDEEWDILLNITFSKGTGDLRIEVPAVPG